MLVLYPLWWRLGWDHGRRCAAARRLSSDARARLAAELREHALVVGKVYAFQRLRRPKYYVDAERAILRPAGFRRPRRAGGGGGPRPLGAPRPWAG